MKKFLRRFSPQKIHRNVEYLCQFRERLGGWLFFPPLILPDDVLAESAQLARYKKDGFIFLEFDMNTLPFSQWQGSANEIGAAVGHTVVTMKQSTDGKRITVKTVPIRSALPDRVYWKEEYLSTDNFKLILGEGLTGKETLDLATTPHVLLGGSSGSGKSFQLKLLLAQALIKNAALIVADFKHGVDFAPVWHKKCQMVFEPQELLDALEQLTQELEHRRKLFVAAGTPNIDAYNEKTGANLRRYILACDEVAEILDKTGLRKEEKELFVQIERHLSLIARQGRAFGLHLILATQRPSADLIPGQIRTNLVFRICGRADDILSRIILDSTAAAEQIPPDATGRFITNMGQIFQGYLFDDSMLESANCTMNCGSDETASADATAEKSQFGQHDTPLHPPKR